MGICTLGKTIVKKTHILDAADKYEKIRNDLELHAIQPLADYLAQGKELHDRTVPGPTVSVGWSASVARKLT